MPTMVEMQERVRLAAAVSASYNATVINTALERAMKRLLRDYNFPKSIRSVFTEGDTEVGQQVYPAPPGFKRILSLRFKDTGSNAYSHALKRRHGFTLPLANPTEADLYGTYYWLEGTNILVDRPAPVSSIRLTVWHQSQLLDDAMKAWMLEDLEDLIFSRATFLVTSELRKEELAQLFAARVAEETQSIAIYANELEWEGMDMHMREVSGWPAERYPS